MEPLWGIDLGGTKIEGAILPSLNDPSPVIRTRIDTEASKGYEHIIRQIEKLVKQMQTESGLTPQKIGFGTPGVLDPFLQTMKNCNSPALNGRPLKKDLEDKMGIRIEPGIDKFYISWSATDNGDRSFALVHEELKVGTPVTLIRKNSWFVKTENTLVGCLKNEVSTTITNSAKGATEISGFVCSNIYKWTLQETIA